LSAALEHDLRACARLARSHYENFAVGSLLMPRRLRLSLAAIYATVRIADDLADEPAQGVEPRRALADWERGLEAAALGRPAPHFAQRACGAVIRELGLPLDLFRALFRAFRRDTVQQRYETWEELLGYCRDSANPVGRLVLLLFGEHDPELFQASDQICTGLQLVNHWQDVAEDARRGRIYLPTEDLTRFAVDPEALLRGDESPGLRALLAFETARARELLEKGGALVAATRGRLRLEVALFRRAGLVACDALAEAEYAVLQGAPRLGGRQRLRIVWGGLHDAVRATRIRKEAPAAVAGELARPEAPHGA
jgi:squalene synthase HpnC